MIQIENLSKSYGKNLILDAISVQFEKGKVHGIVGVNGSGKTTLFRCIAGLEKYTGSITTNFKEIKNHLGYLSTEPYFFDKITGKEYIQLLLNSRNIPLGDIEVQNIFDLPLKKYAATYSTGMKKKLALMAILLQKNDFFILDEPFNGVDIQSNMIITTIIQKLNALEKTTLISSHIFSVLAETCDYIYVLEEGKIKEKVLKQDFDLLEKEMKDFSIRNVVDKLNIT